MHKRRHNDECLGGSCKDGLIFLHVIGQRSSILCLQSTCSALALCRKWKPPATDEEKQEKKKKAEDRKRKREAEKQEKEVKKE